MKNPHKALEAIEILVGSDWGMDMEWVAKTEKNPKRCVSRLREAGKIITQIYCIAHSETRHQCGHEDWEKIKYNILQKNEDL